MFKKIIVLFSKNIFIKVSLLAAFILNLSFFILYLKFDNTPPHWDAGRHYFTSIRYWEIFKNILIENRPNGRLDAIREFLSRYFYYPPGYYYITMPFLALGRGYRFALSSNILWIVLSSVSIVAFLRKLNFSWFSTGISLLFFTGSAFIIGQSREYQLDFPNFTMVLVSVTALEFLTQKFNYRNLTFAAVSISFGALVKWHFLLFMAPIILFYALRWGYLAFKYKRKDLGYLYLTAYTLLSTFLTFTGIWYASNLTRLKIDLTKNSGQSGIDEGDPQGFTTETYQLFIRFFTIEYFGLWWLLFFAVILVAGIYLVYKNFNKIKSEISTNIRFVYIGLFALFIFISMLLYHIRQSNKDIRYIIILYLPLIIIFALLSEIIFRYINKKIVINILFSLSLVIFLFNQINMTLPIENEATFLFKESKTPITLVPSMAYTNTRLKNKDWAIYKALAKTSELNGEYLNKDSCVKDWYWSARPTINPDFAPNLLHSSFGSLWGLSEEYGLTLPDSEDSCYVLIGRIQPKNEIEVSKYLEKYTVVERYDDWQGLNMVLLKKKIKN